MFLVIDTNLTWKLFSQTGNIETYLLLKELENDHNRNNIIPNQPKQVDSFESKM